MDEHVFGGANYIADHHAQRNWIGSVSLAAKIRLRTAIYNEVLIERQRCADIAAKFREDGDAYGESYERSQYHVASRIEDQILSGARA